MHVSDMLKIVEGEQFPADLVFMKSSGSAGLGFVDTMNLDGETNLKERIAIEATNALADALIAS